MKRTALFLLPVLMVVAAGCAGPERTGRTFTTNRAEADYRDEVTGRQFRDASRPVDVEVVRFAALTATRNAQTLIVNATPAATLATAAVQETTGPRPPRTATGLRPVRISRRLRVPTPVTGSVEPDSVSRGVAMARLVGEASARHFMGWREVLAAEARSRTKAAASPTRPSVLVQWPHGVHEINSDITLASVLVHEDIVAPKAPIVILDFLTRFDQRPKMVLTKEVDRKRAYVGEVLTYTITFFNDSPVEASNVLILDVVDEHCQYKPDTAQCSKPHTFKLEETPEKQPVLTWRLKDPVGPHEAGTITYQLVVRKAWVD